MDAVECVQQANAILGEGPIWSVAEQVLYWVDIQRPAVFRFDPSRGQTGHWPMKSHVGFVAPARSGGLVYAGADGFGLLDLNTGETRSIGHPEAGTPGNRFNDGKVDRGGRVWAGTMDYGLARPTANLYRLTPDGTIRHMVGGIICSNGLGWSPDNRTLYYTDSLVRTIWTYEFDAATGTLGERKIFATFSNDDGAPDGLTVDSQGFVWSAIWDGWRIVRFAPDGSIDREVRMPVQRPSSCAFGGPDLKTLYITTACVELGWNSLKNAPLAGALFALRTDVPGVPETPFAN
jgi:L-arabinonolactonase